MANEEDIERDMKFTPRSVNLVSRGKWVTVWLEFSADVVTKTSI